MMMSKNLLVQVAMIALSIGIVITFVEPTFSEIGELQDDIAVYQTEQRKVSEVNNQLSSLVRVLNEVVPDDQRRLLTYMPDTVDTISVVRDLSLISNEAGVLFVSAVSAGLKNATNQSEKVADSIQPKEHLFTLSVEGTYGQLKNLFILLEQNNYPMEAQNVVVQKREGGFLSMEVSLSVFSLEDSVSSEKIVF
jgi:hypothetical protein